MLAWRGAELTPNDHHIKLFLFFQNFFLALFLLSRSVVVHTIKTKVCSVKRGSTPTPPNVNKRGPAYGRPQRTSVSSFFFPSFFGFYASPLDQLRVSCVCHIFPHVYECVSSRWFMREVCICVQTSKCVLCCVFYCCRPPLRPTSSSAYAGDQQVVSFWSLSVYVHFPRGIHALVVCKCNVEHVEKWYVFQSYFVWYGRVWSLIHALPWLLCDLNELVWCIYCEWYTYMCTWACIPLTRCARQDLSIFRLKKSFCMYVLGDKE